MGEAALLAALRVPSFPEATALLPLSTCVTLLGEQLLSGPWRPCGLLVYSASQEFSAAASLGQGWPCPPSFTSIQNLSLHQFTCPQV